MTGTRLEQALRTDAGACIRTAVVGGRVVTESGVSASTILIDGNGKIAGVVAPELRVTSDEVLDASGMLVFPGGVDAHSHLNDPGHCESEDFYTGTAGAAAGGFTTVLEMPQSVPLVTTAELLCAKLEALAPKAIVDFGLWCALVPDNAEDEATLAAVAEAGAIGLKAFMAESSEFPHVSDSQLLRGMRHASVLGLPVGVHCESQAFIDVATDDLAREGRSDLMATALSRPPEAEIEAVRALLALASNVEVALHLVHLSQPQSIELAREARARGVDVTAETCPHYLVLSVDDLLKSGPWAVCQPPLRRAEDREGMWRLLGAGFIDTVGSDHCAYTREEKENSDVWQVAPGINGIQLALPLLVGGALQRGVSLTAVARAFSSQPARRFGLYPRKGAIVPGADADLVLADVGQSWMVDAARLYSRCPGTPYEGMAMSVKIRRTLVRGCSVFVDDGEPSLRVDGGYGVFLSSRATPNR